MKTEIAYCFDELTIDFDFVNKRLGYAEGPVPEPFASYLEMVWADCRQLIDICGAFHIRDTFEFSGTKSSFVTGGVEFKAGKTICKELQDADKLAFFVCTAGKTISEKSSNLMKGEDVVLGYMYDIAGSAIAEAVGDRIQETIARQVALSGSKITNRYSPGYCYWSVADQPKLFSFFGDKPSGVSLTESCLMSPVKSISGVIGIGKEVFYRDYQCDLCKLTNCVYKKTG
ncbi:MAG: vitamin B12 dependent-methionine synthase activation domain-containing protein [Mangrovibacterium sp.]